MISRVYRNGTTATYSYNANDWIMSLDHSKGVVRIAGFAHDFDNEGNKRFEQKLADAANSQTRSEAYQYDKIYRLIDYKVGTLVGSTVPVPTTQTQYTLDPVGNWNVKTKDAIPETRTHSVTNEITQIGVVPVFSDFNGNTSEDGLYRYAYDEENRLTAVTRKSDNRLVGQYQYDALSRRVKKIADPPAVSSPTETRYFYDDARIVEEQTPLGTTQATYVYGNYVDEILTMDRAGRPSTTTRTACGRWRRSPMLQAPSSSATPTTPMGCPQYSMAPALRSRPIPGARRTAPSATRGCSPDASSMRRPESTSTALDTTIRSREGSCRGIRRTGMQHCPTLTRRRRRLQRKRPEKTTIAADSCSEAWSFKKGGGLAENEERRREVCSSGCQEGSTVSV